MIALFRNLPKYIVWTLAFPVFVLYGWLALLIFNYFQPLISLFIASILFAFILDYPVKFLQKRGVLRTNAVVLVFLIALLVFLALAITLFPLIIEQLNEFSKRLPSWIDSGIKQLQVLNKWAVTRNLPLDLSEVATKQTERLSGQIDSVTGSILGFAIETLGSVLNLFLTAVLTFYLVLHGERLWDGIFLWFPPNIGPIVRRSLRQNFHNYFIGQSTLAALSGVAMTLAFLAIQVPLALLFGFGLGLMGLFPLMTGVGISLVGLLLALQNFWLGMKVLLIAFSIDWVNANLIAPRILGGFTGLNPVWILVSLLLGAKIGGVLGLLIAVPLASFIKSTADSLRDGTWN
ncbi:AI-2E family transporter [Microcoleus sp. FACHB-672]|uniref:AI-2E family transporter n=1 Tax=Microcoleus sp. FACHB-672 TaxID=2692825 RepID=UPI001682994D|nr:AI-2E family transporter [Microcoleus sp. FACHB-672]MBD2040885.1 AI-2E family transporter [Microcoleus sp. FACHB-672]